MEIAESPARRDSQCDPSNGIRSPPATPQKSMEVDAGGAGNSDATYSPGEPGLPTPVGAGGPETGSPEHAAWVAVLLSTGDQSKLPSILPP
eukprot:10393614-Heterocapsa_arctica.AAC.1